MARLPAVALALLLAAACEPSAAGPSAARDFTDWDFEPAPAEPCPDICGPNDWSCRGEALACRGRATAQALAGDAVAAAIRQAIAIVEDGSQPMPADIRERLLPFFEEDLLDRARYSVGFPSGLSVLGLQHHLRTASAMTFADHIVFADEAAAGNACLWAHELEHVRQYARLGIDGFARRFALASASLEQPGYDQQAYVCGLIAP